MSAPVVSAPRPAKSGTGKRTSVNQPAGGTLGSIVLWAYAILALVPLVLMVSKYMVLTVILFINFLVITRI